MTVTMTAIPIANTVAMKRLTEFAGDVAQLADVRPDLELEHSRRFTAFVKLASGKEITSDGQEASPAQYLAT